MASDAASPTEGPLFRAFRRVVDVRREEVAALGWSWLFVFSLFLSYSVLRPIRDEMGVAGGVRNLPWLFTGTLVAMLALQPLFAATVRRLSRDRFIALTYRFFMANLLLFMALLAWAPPDWNVWVGRAFFIWVSVFNLFVVSVFWSFVVDAFDSEQGKRLFGILAAGATLGAIAGSSLTAGFVERLGQTPLLLISIVLLEVAVFAARHLSRVSAGFRHPAGHATGDGPVGGGVLSGLTHTLRSPYLLGIAGFILIYAVTSTFLYFQQASIAETAFTTRGARTAFFAEVDLWVNVLTLFFQLFLTARILAVAGVAVTLAALPLFSAIGFGVLALAPSVAAIVAVQVARRVGNFALARPTRELLFTVLPREDRYKAKNFIDTVVYRGGDQVGAWAFAGLGALGLGLTGISVVAVPLSLLWFGVAYWLGRRQEASARGDAGGTGAPAAIPRAA